MSDNERVLTANFTADTSGFAPKINELIGKLKTLNQDFEQNKQKVNELNAKIKEYQKELSQLNSATNNGANATVQQERRMQELRDSIAACNTQIGTYRAAQGALRSQINSTNRELTEQQQAFNSVNTAAMSFGDILKANLASSAIQSGLRATLNYLREAAAYCYEVGSSFEAAMSNVAAVSGASANELEQLTAKAKDLGSTTKFTASETAAAMNYMAMAGWKTEEMLAGIDGVLGLAAASGTDLATTSDIVTDALTAFGLSASDCAHFADVLAAASSNANTNVSMMGETFKYCAPIAGALGFSAEDVAVRIGLMANSGIKATQAGTAMRTVMTNLAKDVEITGRKIGTVTVETTNADGSMREFAAILTDLRAVFSQLDDDERALTAETIAGKNAMTGFLALMNAGEADVQKLTAAIKNCDGAASAMADTMQDNLQGAVTKFNSALEGVGIAVYDKFKNGLTEAVNIFTDAMNDMRDSVEGGGALYYSLENLASSFKDAAREIAVITKTELPDFVNGLAKGIDFVITFRKEIASAVTGFVAFKAAMSIGNTINAAVASYRSLKTALDAAKASQVALNVAMDANPIGLVAAAVGLLVAGLTELSLHANNSAQSLENLRISSNEAARSAEEFSNKSKSLDDIKKRYEEVTHSAEDAADKTADLKTLQNELISQFPELKGQIDLVTGAYNDMADALADVSQRAKDAALYDAKTALEQARKAEIQSNENGSFFKLEKDTAKPSGFGISTMEKYGDRLQLNGTDLSISGTLEERRDIIESLYKELQDAGLDYTQTAFARALSSELTELDGFIADLEDKAQKIKDIEFEINHPEFANYNYSALGTSQYSAHSGGTVLGVSGGSEYARHSGGAVIIAEQEEIQKELSAAQIEALEKQYNEEKKMLDAKHAAGVIAEKEYYEQLKQLRDKCLQEDTLAWYNATAAINSAYEKWQNAASGAASKIKSSLDEVQMAYKKTLAAIDAEIERHNREKSDAAFQKKIDEIDEQLKYGRLDDFSKYELEKERQRLIDEHDEELYTRSAADAKAAVTNAYNAQQTYLKAEKGTREYTLAVSDYTDALGDLTQMMREVGVALGVENGSTTNNTSIDESTKNIYVNTVLQAVNRSTDQIVDELIKRLHSGL